MSIRQRRGGDWLGWGWPSATAKWARKQVLDWLLWFLVPIGLFVLFLVILGLKFLRDLERNERERGDDH